MLLEAYENSYRIYNHDAASARRPLSSVAMHPKEDYTRASGLYRRLERFAATEIGNKFNISIKEFLSLPREYVELMEEIMTAEAEREAPELLRQKQELEKLKGGPR